MCLVTVAIMQRNTTDLLQALYDMIKKACPMQTLPPVDEVCGSINATKK